MRQLAGIAAVFCIIAIAGYTQTPQGAPWSLVSAGGRTRVAWNYPFEAINAQRQNGIRFADQFPSIQSALDDASKMGAVVIPPGLAQGNAYSNPNNIPVLDLRPRAAEIGVWSQIAASRPIANYPLGADLRLIAHGAADLWLSHDTNDAAKTTTASSLAFGLNRSIPVGDTSKFSSQAPIWIGRETAEEELVGEGRWSIVDGTHISVTCVHTHIGPTDIEQIGSTIIDGGDRIILKPEDPAHLAGRHANVRFFDSAGHPLFYVPGNAADAAPSGTFRMFIPLTLGNGTPVSKLQHKRVASCTTAAYVGATCDAKLAWDHSFDDTNYTVECNLTGVSNQPRLMSIPTKTAMGLIVRIEAATAAAAGGTVECTALHD